MFGLWLIVAILVLAIGSYAIGTLDWDGDEKVGLFWAIVIGSFAWPLVLTTAIVVGPFFGLFWLGNRRRQKQKESIKNK